MLNFIEKVKEDLKAKTNPRMFQVVGSVLLVLFYVLLAFAKRGSNPDLAASLVWIFVGAPVGIIELAVIWLHDTTITKWVRNLANKKVDTIVMLSLIGVTWWLAGPFAAGYFFMGFLDNHFGEKQI